MFASRVHITVVVSGRASRTASGRGRTYAYLFPATVAAWRRHFAQPELPRVYVSSSRSSPTTTLKRRTAPVT